LNVPVSTNISVTFDMAMDQTTINDSTFVVNARSTGLHAGTITYDGPSKTATFDPAADFDQGEVVTVTLTTGVKSYEGAPLEDGHLWSFTSTVDDGAGIFAPHSVYGAGDYPRSVFSADLDGDGDLDLAATNDASDNVSVLLNEPGFTRGDANGDGIINVGDIVYLVSYLYKNGPAPSPIDAGDCNCDDIVNVGDVVYLVSYLYKGGPPPRLPQGSPIRSCRTRPHLELSRLYVDLANVRGKETWIRAGDQSSEASKVLQ
jgi:hypothetical protein